MCYNHVLCKIRQIKERDRKRLFCLRGPRKTDKCQCSIQQKSILELLWITLGIPNLMKLSENYSNKCKIICKLITVGWENCREYLLAQERLVLQMTQMRVSWTKTGDWIWRNGATGVLIRAKLQHLSRLIIVLRPWQSEEECWTAATASHPPGVPEMPGLPITKT